MQLVKQYQKNYDKEIVISIDKAVNSSIELRSKLKLIHLFLENINPDTDVDEEWKKFVDAQRRTALDEIIKEEDLKQIETYHFVANAFRDGVLKTTGTDIDLILPAVSRFGGGNRDEKKNRVIDRLQVYYEIFIDMFFGDNTLDK